MRGRTVVTGNDGGSCGIHGCMSVAINHVGGGEIQTAVTPVDNAGLDVATEIKIKPFTVSTNVQNPAYSVVASPKDNAGLQVETRLVCRTGQGQWEYLMVDEGVIMLIDGQCVLVRRSRNE